jgi:Ca2+-binding EF-hand superfamily protein
MRFPCAHGLAFGTGLVVLLASATAHGQNQPPAKATPAVNVIIVIQTQPGSPGGQETLALPAGVSITTMTLPPGAVRVGPVAVTPAKPVATTPSKTVSYKPGDKFGMLDIDKDGKLSRAEFKGPKNVFATVDADHDDFISKPEATRVYLAFVGRMAIEEKAQAFKAMDTNHDGKLSAAEFKRPKPLFARIDADHDGFVSRAEAAKAFQDHVHAAMVVAGLKSMDKNKDGKLTPEEFTGSIAQFLKLDVDKNGVITKDDVTRVITTAIAAKAKAPALPKLADPRPLRRQRPPSRCMLPPPPPWPRRS